MIPPQSWPPQKLLVLFDIDGTLVRQAGQHHRNALVEAVRNITGLETTTEDIPVHGMLDRDILSQMIRNTGAGDDAIERWMPSIVEEAQAIYVESCPPLRDKLCPGVPGLLNALRDARVPMALVTGNLSRIGWKKLEQAGLREYFRWGAFAEMAETRGQLAALAIEQVRAGGIEVPREHVLLIGDAPSDIQAARENGIRVISVCTGISTREQLAAHDPDVLLDSFEGILFSTPAGN